MHDPEKSDFGHSSDEADEQSRATGGGVGGAKAGDQGKRGPTKHAPDTEPGSRDPGAGRRTDKPQGKGRRNSSPRSSTTSMSTCSGQRSMRSSAKPRRAWMASTWRDYEADLEPRLEDLHERVHRGAYRPQPSRRTYIPKADGKQRPLAIAALEDKIVQGATVMVLNAIYEGDFRRLLLRVSTWTGTA